MGRESRAVIERAVPQIGGLWGTCRESRAVAGLGWVLLEGKGRHHSVE